MGINEFLDHFSKDGYFRTIVSAITDDDQSNINVKGLRGSIDAIIAAACYKYKAQTHLFILPDKDAAGYFHNDLKHLLGKNTPLYFPSSYKRPYQFEETDNANVLLRAEVLNQLNVQKSYGNIIVTYPEALTEKVINKQSLVNNTFIARVGEKLDVNFISEILTEYDFESADFVYEAGQYALRGGIVDVFSYANEYPYRIELFGDEIESIRTFNPETQLSVESKDYVSIIPDVQQKLTRDSYESFFNFLEENTRIWIKDRLYLEEVIAENFKKAGEVFNDLVYHSGGKGVISNPEEKFESLQAFSGSLDSFKKVEFGTKFYDDQSKTFTYSVQEQPSFKKDFKALVKNLNAYKDQHYELYLLSEHPHQIDKLGTLIEELDPYLGFRAVHNSFSAGFIDDQTKVVCYTDHQLLERYYGYKTHQRFTKSKTLTIRELRTLQPGDYVVHTDYGIAKFAGMEKIEVNGVEQEVIRLLFKDNDLMKISVQSLHKISKYSSKDGEPPQVSKLGSPEWNNKKKKVKKRVKDIAKELIDLYAKRKGAPGFAFSSDNFMQAELETSFIYEDTADQAQATLDVKSDMEKPHPMDRLVCGDVGFGKTEVAVRAAFKAVCDNKQVALLVPTTILAMQHYQTFKQRLAQMPCRIDYINRFKSAKEIKDTLKSVKDGNTDILIGTHRMVSKDVDFHDLGLLIIDEEQKFGVSIKEKLKQMRVNLDTLTLTATPIPRTLHFSLMGARDLSVIATPPPNRQPVTTEVHTYHEEILRDAIRREVERNGQVFVIHNRVTDLESIGDAIVRLVPGIRLGVAHGQMSGEKLEKVMLKFIEGEYDVLVSTNIVESGLDIPNANTIIINQAHQFGLSDLHQMRGRVGRSNVKAYCYLLTPSLTGLPADSRKRLMALEEFSDLGDGYKVAMRDLDIRGAGNLLGAEQSGFISDIGFETYHQILDEAVQELKENEFKALFEQEPKNIKQFVPDCVIETDLSLLIPEDYVSSITERLKLYTELDNIKEEQVREDFTTKLKDRFGPLPKEVVDLIETVKLRWKAEELGIEKVLIKQEVLKCYFPGDNKEFFSSSVFGAVLAYVQNNPDKCIMKEMKDKLVLKIEGVASVYDAIRLFDKIMTYNDMVENQVS